MRRNVGILVALIALAAFAAAAGQANVSGTKARQAPVKISFFSLAWQEPVVKANKDIVAAFNRSHPNIQVEYVQGDWGSVHDKLLTSFVGGTAPDVIHDEAADIAGFTKQGYLADLKPLLPKKLRNSIPSRIWATTTFDGKLTGVPFLLQSYNVFANATMLKQAGVKLPTIDKPWTWFQFRQAARKLTRDGKYGVGWGLRSPVATVVSMSLNFNGKFFYRQGGRTVVKFGTPEQQVPRRMHDMIHVDKSVDPSTVGQSGSAVLPGFFAGKYGMTVQGNYAAQQMVEQAPAGFKWVMLPQLKGSSQFQSADPQTLSIPKQSKNKRAAMTFIAYFLNEKNMASLAAGDWLIPTAPKAGKRILAQTKYKGSWRVAMSSLKNLKLSPWARVENYPRWKDQIAQGPLSSATSRTGSASKSWGKSSSGWQQV